jgi:hypothetical protein
MDASLGGGAEVIKTPNFIEFYEISRLLHLDKARGNPGRQGTGPTWASRNIPHNPEDSPEEVGFSHGKFCRQGAGWSNQMKTRREGRSPLKSGSIVILDRAW